MSAAGCSASRRGGASGKLGVVKGLYIVAGVTMAGVSAVFVLLAELEDRYGLTKAGLGLIAGSAFGPRLSRSSAWLATPTAVTACCCCASV